MNENSTDRMPLIHLSGVSRENLVRGNETLSPLIYTIDRVPTGILIRMVERARTDAASQNCCRAFRRGSIQRGETSALKAL
jgi:hypothetical protein